MWGVCDLNTSLIFILTILSAILCIAYGIIKWNSDGNISRETALKEAAWESEEHRIEGELSGESPS